MEPSLKWTAVGLVLLGGLAARSFVARAADHGDGTVTAKDPSTDITDVFAWMSSDTKKLNLVLDVYPNAPNNAQFSTAALYTIHVNSRMSAGADGTDTDVRCTFDTTQKVSCWIGDDPAPALDYVTGDASGTAGIMSADKRLQVFTGLRDDPFFLNFDGFLHATATVANATGLPVDPSGCPTVDAGVSGALVNQLKTSADGGAPVNFAAGWRVLSIVVQVDTSLMNSGGPIFAVLGSTSPLVK